LLLDGLQAEREQGITVDVAYRYFETPNRAFIVADSPGHEQYIRNMATAASTSEVALVLVDARKGLVTQTRLHFALLSLFGIRRVVAIVNKIDLVGFREAPFVDVAKACRDAAKAAGLGEIECIPVSALAGDNVVHRGERLDWYHGPTLLQWLETVEVEAAAAMPFRMPVQWVNRGVADFRGYAGLVVSGSIRPGDRIVAAPSGLHTTVARIITFDGDLSEAEAGQAVTLTLADPIDVGRGTLLAAAGRPPGVANQFRVRLVGLGRDPILPGRSYLMRIGTTYVPAAITKFSHRVDIEAHAHIATTTLSVNEIAVCNLSTHHPIPFDTYADNRDTGGFILIDRITNQTIAAGVVDFALRRSANLAWRQFEVDRTAHARLKGQRPAILWLTGLSGAGKSTIADILERKLVAQGRHTFILDGDNVRHGLNKDLGFTEVDRVENIRRVAEVARLMAEAGLIVIVSFISPFARERMLAREIAGDIEFLEIFVDTPMEVCERRDSKGLYAKARAGLLQNFTGIDSPYEAPAHPDLRLAAALPPPDSLAEEIVLELVKRGLV